MSLITLSPNAAGTGTFTIASPNSNTDRTLSLPDASGTVMVSGSPVSGTTGTFTGLVDISAAGAGQIQFPVTQNASANANTLDDYEEGTWTPTITLSNVSITNVIGAFYTKVGRVVTAYCYVIVNNLTGSTVLSLSVAGLPFASLNYGMAFNYFGNGPLSGNSYVESGATFAPITGNFPSGASGQMFGFVYFV